MTANPLPEGAARLVVLVSASATAGAGALALAGWAAGAERLAAFGSGLYPMAPNTALLFVVLGSAVFVREARPASRALRRATAASGLLGALVGTATLFGSVTGLRIDDLLFESTRRFNGVPTGRMALATAFCFLLMGASLIRSKAEGDTPAAIMGILISLTGTVSLAGYAFGIPIVNGEFLIPVALPTSLALMSMGMSLAASARPDPWPHLAIAASTALAIFALDLLTPREHAVWVFYLIPVLLTLRERGRRIPVAMAAVCTALVIAAPLFSPAGVSPSIAIFNRSAGVAVLWVATALLARLRQTLEELSERDRDFREAQRIARLGSWHYAPTGRITWSSETTRIFGLSPEAEALTPESFFDLIHPEDQPAIQAWIAACGAGEEPGEIEFRCIRQDGTLRWLSGRGERKRDVRGEPDHIVGTVQDVTHRKSSEQALREFAERLSFVVRETKTGLWDWHLATNEVHYSQEWKRLLGYEDHEIASDLGEWRRLAHPQDVEPTLAAVSSYLRQPTGNLEVEFRMRSKGGEYRWILSIATARMDEHGKPADLVGLHIDISQRKTMEEELKRNRALLRLFVEHVPASIAMLDSEMKYIAVSQRFLADYRIGDKTITGLSHYEVFPDIPERWKEIYERCQAGAIETAAEDPFPRSDGRLDWVRWEIHPWREGDGSIGGIVLFSEVITDRKRAEEELRRSEERFSDAFHLSPAGMAITSVADGRLLHVNDSFLRMFELDREDVIGHTSTELSMLCLVDREKWIEPQRGSGGLRNAEHVARAKSGRRVDVLLSSKPLKVDGTDCLITTLIDITERKQVEAALRDLSLKLNRAEEAERRRIARELHDSTGQKLAALAMTVGQIQDVVRPASGEVEKLFADCLKTIDECARDLRMQSYKLHPPLLDELGLSAAIADYAEGFSRRSGVLVSLDAPREVDRFPNEIEIALFRVLQESLANVHRHARVGAALVRLSSDAEAVVLEVSDPGRGISAETLATIQAGRGIAGVGIPGMTERLRPLGGRLEIVSGRQGTTIRAVVPVRQEAP